MRVKAVIFYLVLAGCLMLSACIGYGRVPSPDADSDRIAAGTDADAVQNLKTEYLTNPIGLDVANPRFSWQFISPENGREQIAYQIKVARSEAALAGETLIWDSGKVESGDNHAIVYAGEILEPASRYFWQVSVWEDENTVLGSTETAFFETGLMDSGWSNAMFISPPKDVNEGAAMLVNESAATPAENLAYTITYDVCLKDSVAGFVFGADTGMYGSFYLWEIGHTGEQGFLRISKVDNNRTEKLQESSLKALFPDASAMNDIMIPVRIEVDRNNTVTYIQDTAVAEQEIEACPSGRIGYLQKRGSAIAYLDNIRVEAADGRLISSEDFEGAESIFTPYYCRTVNGMLEMNNGTLLSRPVEDRTSTAYQEEAAPMFRRELVVQDKPIESARLYATALGIYDFRINGNAVTDDLFNPGKLAYNTRLLYRTHDVSEWLVPGKNAIGAVLGHGWYDRAVGYTDNWNPWGDRTALLAKLVIRYTDGTEQIVVTDEDWKVYEDGPFRSDDIYQGEYYDANYEQDGWAEPGFEESGWENAAVNLISERYQDVPLEGRADSAIVCYEKLAPVSYMQLDDKTYV